MYQLLTVVYYTPTSYYTYYSLSNCVSFSDIGLCLIFPFHICVELMPHLLPPVFPIFKKNKKNKTYRTQYQLPCLEIIKPVHIFLLFSPYIYHFPVKTVSYEEIFPGNFGVGGVKNFLGKKHVSYEEIFRQNFLAQNSLRKFWLGFS